MIQRRDFITLLGGAVAWPLVARAQQPGRLPTIGFLGTTDPSTMRPWITAFVERLRDLGWIEDRTIAIAYRWAEGRPERYAEIAAEFFVSTSTLSSRRDPQAPQAKKATSVIPIVLALSGDPGGCFSCESSATRWQHHWPVDAVARCCRQATRTLARGCPQFSPVGDHGQCRLSRCRAGCERGSGGGSIARPRNRHARNPASGGYRARF